MGDRVPVTVVVGGQFGSEGKGKVACFFARERRATFVFRVGGSNSGHTVVDQRGNTHVFRVLPTAAVLPDVNCVLAAGSYIDPELLFHEVRTIGLAPGRLLIDPNAFVISDEHKRLERQWSLGARIGSTQSGTGASVVDRVMRHSEERLAKHDERLKPFISDSPASMLARARLNRGEHVVIEGTQGFGLSVIHSPYYPKATSRDTTAAAFLSEVGLSPLDVTDVVLVVRTYPIRVAGDSGVLPNEIDWQTVTRECGSAAQISERTSVTKRLRRVGRFDPSIVRRAIAVNSPSIIALNHVDYWDANLSDTSALPDHVNSRH